jgi:hypothetical protein
MDRKRTLIIASLLVAGLAVAAYLAYTFWPASGEGRPTLMYFRADL